MPRLARLDAPGVLHHVIGRGIERKKIFTNDTDRNDFIRRNAAKARGSISWIAVKENWVIPVPMWLDI